MGEKKIISGIYAIINKKDGKRYIGSSKDIKDRCKQHLRALKKGIHYNIYLQRAFNKYKRKAFKFVILKIVNESKLLKTEQQFLDTLDNLYNIAFQAGGGIQPEEILKKISKANKGRITWMKGKRFSKAARQEISKRTKIAMTDEIKKKISENSKGNKSAVGHICSKESRERMSNSHKGQISGMKGKHHSEKTKKSLSEKIKEENIQKNLKKICLKE